MQSSYSYVPFLRTQLQQIAASFSTASCGEGAGGGGGAECRDEAAALRLKMAAVAAILAAGAAGVAVPLAGRERCLGGTLAALAKAFAAGVVLATGFVHVLPDSEAALMDPCLPAAPWRRFPFPGFVAMLAALGTLAADLVCTRDYEGEHRRQQEEADAGD